MNNKCQITNDVEEEYNEVVQMDVLIESFRHEYAKDLAARLGIDKDRLPDAYTITTLLNPMFGLEPLITGTKLMTKQQYDNG
jgi:hypothetical protein